MDGSAKIQIPKTNEKDEDDENDDPTPNGLLQTRRNCIKLDETHKNPCTSNTDTELLKKGQQSEDKINENVVKTFSISVANDFILALANFLLDSSEQMPLNHSPIGVKDLMLANNQFADENAGKKVRNEDENASQKTSATEQIENKLEHNFLFVIYRMLVQTIQMSVESGKMLCDI